MVNIHAGDTSFWADVRPVGEVLSPVTEKPLREYDVVVDVPEAKMDTFSTGLCDGFTLDSGLHAVAAQGHTSSSIPGGWRYSLRLTESESIEPSVVTIGGISMAPSQYHEEVSNGERTITLLASADEATVKTLFKSHDDREPVAVQRPDLGEQEFRMRVCNFMYAEEETGKYVAVSLSTDLAAGDSIPWLSSVGAAGEMAAQARAAGKVIVRELVSKGVLTEEDVATMGEALQRECLVQLMELHRVDSLSMRRV